MIWKDFNLCLIFYNTKKAQCIQCLHFFSKDSNSTLKNHISHPHCEALKRAAELGQSSMSRDGSLFVYNLDILGEQFAGLGFWKAKEKMFPVLSRMAMDILSVQSTSVASESAFSTNHLDPQEHKQDKFTLETPVDFEEEILDAEVKANEAISLSDEEIAFDAASSESSMSGPGSGGEEAEANYGYDIYHDDY
nr:zinc finger BED domain-containing protein RICESLEEPER 2-like [Tanacetum cinerariifolium]